MVEHKTTGDDDCTNCVHLAMHLDRCRKERDALRDREGDDVLRELIRETAGEPNVVRSKYVWRALAELCRRALGEGR